MCEPDDPGGPSSPHVSSPAALDLHIPAAAPIHRHITDGWFKSTFSAASCTCVEVRFTDGPVLVRDSKLVTGTDCDQSLPTIEIALTEWPAFLATVTGERAPAPDRSVDIVTVGDMTVLVSRTTATRLEFTAPEMAAFRAGIHAGEFLPPQMALSGTTGRSGDHTRPTAYRTGACRSAMSEDPRIEQASKP